MVLGVSSTIRFDQASLFFLRNQSTGFTWKISRILQPFKFTCSLFDWRALLIVGENKVHQVVVEDFLKLRGAIGSQGWYNFVAILNLGEFFGPPGHKKNRSQSFGRFFLLKNEFPKHFGDPSAVDFFYCWHLLEVPGNKWAVTKTLVVWLFVCCIWMFPKIVGEIPPNHPF